MDALEDMRYIEPDIIIVDLLMPEIDGITFVKMAHAEYPDTVFVMLSQVSNKEMISAAYEAGVEFFIQKPINAIEVESVLRKVIENLSMKRTLSGMQSLFLTHSHEMNTNKIPPRSTEQSHIKKINNILQHLGIIGETGSNDIIKIVDYIITHLETAPDMTLIDLCSQFSENPKSVEQRIRRAAYSAMNKLAHLGLEDYANASFEEYSYTLFQFDQIRREMDYIRGKNARGGNVKIRSFLNALVSYCSKTSD